MFLYCSAVLSTSVHILVFLICLQDASTIPSPYIKTTKNIFPFMIPHWESLSKITSLLWPPVLPSSEGTRVLILKPEQI
jgi:hypothetical protein